MNGGWTGRPRCDLAALIKRGVAIQHGKVVLMDVALSAQAIARAVHESRTVLCYHGGVWMLQSLEEVAIGEVVGDGLVVLNVGVDGDLDVLVWEGELEG